MESQAAYRYEKYQFRMFTPLMALMCLIFLVYAEYIGASLSFVLGTLLIFTWQGVIIDPERKRYMKYDRFLGFRFGRWEKLPDPSYVTIVRIKLSSRKTAPSPIVIPQDKKGARAFKVNLVVEGEKRFISICKGSLGSMTDEAIRLGQHLGIRVLDYSTHEKKWIL